MQDAGAIGNGPDEILEALIMADRKIQCPSCGAHLFLPEGMTRRVAKCGQCKQKFWLPRPEAVSEEQVAGWLDRQEQDEAVSGPPPEEYPHPVPADHPDHAAHQTLSAFAALDRDMRLISCDSGGALLEFPAQRLTEKPFRCAMPRICVQCGGRSHLEVHVIIYSGVLKDSVSLEAEHAAGTLVLRSDEVKDLSIQDVLERLPRVPNVPAPADLPMPYWLCDQCSSSKTISGQLQINRDTGEGWCRLLIRNLRRAEEFLDAVGARGSHPFHEIARHVAEMGDNPWDSLPLVVQHRLQQWFKAAAGERFLAYVPDRDHARTEDGMFGLAVSDRRLIHHMPLRHWESEVSRPLDLVLSAGKKKGQLVVTIAAWKCPIQVDGDGIAKLRRALTIGKFRANWS
jgi:hypothetical protein